MRNAYTRCHYLWLCPSHSTSLRNSNCHSGCILSVPGKLLSFDFIANTNSFFPPLLVITRCCSSLLFSHPLIWSLSNIRSETITIQHKSTHIAYANRHKVNSPSSRILPEITLISLSRPLQVCAVSFTTLTFLYPPFVSNPFQRKTSDWKLNTAAVHITLYASGNIVNANEFGFNGWNFMGSRPLKFYVIHENPMLVSRYFIKVSIQMTILDVLVIRMNSLCKHSLCKHSPNYPHYVEYF